MMLRRYRMGHQQLSLGRRGKFPLKANRISARRRDERGSALVEFAIVFPLLIVLVMGIITFGQAFGNYQRLTNSAAAGAEAISVARGNTLNPCTTVSTAALNSWPVAAQSNLKFTITVAPATTGAAILYTLASNAANPTCVAPTTTTGTAADLVQGDNVTVQITYPCQLQVFTVNFVPNCTLTATTVEAIQ